MVEVISSIEFDNNKAEKYCMIKIYDSESDYLRESVRFYEQHLKLKQKPHPDPVDSKKLRTVSEIKRSIDIVWERLNS